MNGAEMHLGALLGQNDNLPTRFVFFHAAMGLDDLIEGKHLTDLWPQRAFLDLLHQLLKRCANEILRAAPHKSSGSQPSGSRPWG